MAFSWVASHPFGVHVFVESFSQVAAKQVDDPQHVLASNGQYVGSGEATAVTAALAVWKWPSSVASVTSMKTGGFERRDILQRSAEKEPIECANEGRQKRRLCYGPKSRGSGTENAWIWNGKCVDLIGRSNDWLKLAGKYLHAMTHR